QITSLPLDHRWTDAINVRAEWPRDVHQLLQVVVGLRFDRAPVELRHARADVGAAVAQRINMRRGDYEQALTRDHRSVAEVRLQPLGELLRFVAAMLEHLVNRGQALQPTCTNDDGDLVAERIQERAPLGSMASFCSRAGYRQVDLRQSPDGQT